MSEGAGLNPGRCFAAAVARGDFKSKFFAIDRINLLIQTRSVDLVDGPIDWKFVPRRGLLCGTSISPTNSPGACDFACSSSTTSKW